MPSITRLSLLLILTCAAACTTPTPEVVHPTSAPTNTPKDAPPSVNYQETSDSTRADIDKALTLSANGQTDAALSALHATLDADPKAFLAAYNIAVLLDQQDKPQDAASFYERTLSIEPDFTPALLNLARITIRDGNSPLDLIDRHIALRPDNIGHKLTRLDALIALGRPEDAIADARAVLKLDEANARARYYLAYAHYLRNRFPLSQFIINGALEIDQADPEIFFLSGLIHISLEELPEAAENFRRATELRPDFPEAQNALGLSLYRIRDFDGAEAAFSAAIKYEPTLHEAYLNLGNTLKALARGDDSERAYLKALELKPSWPDAHFSLGTLYLAIDAVPLSAFGSTSDDKLKRLDVARAKIEEAQKLWSNDPPNSKLAAEFITKVERNVEAVNEAKFFEEGSWDDGSGGGGGGGDEWDDGSGGGGGGGGGGGDEWDDGSGGDNPSAPPDAPAPDAPAPAPDAPAPAPDAPAPAPDAPAPTDEWDDK
jgi:tetratricopeptide (TPR) repeat protein